METLIDGQFGQVLRAHRSVFNARFAQARRARPTLAPDAFRDLLRSTVAPIVTAVEGQAPAKTAAVVHVLYDLALDLLGQGFLGPQARYPCITQGWRELLPRIPAYLAAAPRRVAGAVTNALYTLSATPGARPEEWIERMQRLGPLCPDEETWLKAGQAAAWRAGMAHYRNGALDLGRVLEPAVARTALGLPATGDLPVLLSRLTADPWLHPADAGDPPGPRPLQIVARVGAFRGLGGLFRTPPVVTMAGEHWLVRDGAVGWLLVADCLGATWHRTDALATPPQPTPFCISTDGAVCRGCQQQTFPELAGFTAAVANSTTLAVTTPFSFAVHLVAQQQASSCRE